MFCHAGWWVSIYHAGDWARSVYSVASPGRRVGAPGPRRSLSAGGEGERREPDPPDTPRAAPSPSASRGSTRSAAAADGASRGRCWPRCGPGERPRQRWRSRGCSSRSCVCRRRGAGTWLRFAARDRSGSLVVGASAGSRSTCGHDYPPRLPASVVWVRGASDAGQSSVHKALPAPT